MNIATHQDIVAGATCHAQALLNQLQSEGQREAEDDKRRLAEKQLRESMRQILCRELSSKEQFVELATKMYDYALNNVKLNRNKKPLQVVEMRVSDWAICSNKILSMLLEVELSGNAGTTYHDPFVLMSMPEMLHPFKIHGFSKFDEKTRRSTCTYGLSAELSSLPLLLKSTKAAAGN